MVIDMGYCIRFARKADTDNIMKFINEYWRKNHILSRDKELFEWQYGGNDDKLNIVLGFDENESIQGMLGFVAYDDSDSKDIALALWKANPSTGFLGVKLIKYLIENEPHREIVCPGINVETTAKIYEHLGMHVGTMTQWYRLSKVSSYHIAKVVDGHIPSYCIIDKEIDFIKISDIESLKSIFGGFICSDSNVPYKSIGYVENRYFKHPRYVYHPYVIRNNTEKTNTLIIFRIQECNNSRALRLIDCIGDVNNLRFITRHLDDLLIENKCEYVDCYETGIDDKLMESGGWIKATNEGNVIPDYFSPFDLRKVDIYYSTSSATAVLLKGDGDQDRPN